MSDPPLRAAGDEQGESSLDGVLAASSIVICAGSGGVGKTTVAAALALGAAARGRRTCVVTVDPARRLADALGISELTNEPRPVEGPWRGELWAMMLDSKSTFDQLVRRYAASPAQAEEILHNRLYRNLSAALSGTQEYMASEKLYELHEEDRFELVVVDTPPTRNALDFLDAPGRLTRLLENRMFRLVVMPTRAYLRALSIGLRAFLRSISSVVGTEVVDDTVAFFQAFEGMEEGFRQRARRVEALLAQPGTTFALVTTPRTESVTEARWFADRLRAMGLRVGALVINRAHPHFFTGPAADGAVGTLFPDATSSGLGAEPLRGLVSLLADLESAATAEDDAVADLGAQLGGVPVCRVPLRADDVHDVSSLAELGKFLFAS